MAFLNRYQHEGSDYSRMINLASCATCKDGAVRRVYFRKIRIPRAVTKRIKKGHESKLNEKARVSRIREGENLFMEVPLIKMYSSWRLVEFHSREDSPRGIALASQ